VEQLKIIDFSIKRPVFTIVIMIVFLLLGGVSLTRIPLKLIPSINPPIGAVVASYNGAGPEEVLQKVTKPLEAQLSTIQGLKDISSTSQEGTSLIILQFTNDTKINDIQSDIQNAIDRTPLPDEVQNARFLKFDPSQFPIIQMAINSKENVKSKDFNDKISRLQTELTQVKGVASVETKGLTVEQIVVSLDQEQMKKYGLNQGMIVQALQASNVSLPGATVKSGDKELTTRVIAPIHTIKDIQEIKITTPFRKIISLNDVANVKKAPIDDGIITRNNQEPAIFMSVLQQSDANTETVSSDFLQKLNELKTESQYKDLKTSIIFNQGDLVDQAIGSLRDALILGAVLSMLVLFFFLKNLKTPLIIGVSIPFSVIVTFVLIYFSGFTLNIMTLGGLALGIGMLVDNSIVVIENVYRHLNMGENPNQAALQGTKEVGVAIIASTLTTVVVFLPVLFVTGIIGELFKQFALTIAFSLLASLLVAMTVVPMMASRMLKTPSENVEEKRRASMSMRVLGNMITWSLHHRAIVIFISLILFGAGIFGLTRVGAVFLPDQDQSFFSVDVTMPNGTALTKTNQSVKAIENVLRNKKEVKNVFSLVGSTQNMGPASASNSNRAQIYVNLVDPDKRDLTTSQFVEKVRHQIEKAADGAKEITISQQNAMGTEPNTLTFRVMSNHLADLNGAVDKITKSLKGMKNTQEVTNNLTDTVQELKIDIDRDAATKVGLTPQQIAQTVNMATRGVNAMQVTTDNDQVLTVHVSYERNLTETQDGLENLLIQTPQGLTVKLGDLATISTGDSPTVINRTDQERAVQFTVKYSNKTTLAEYKKAVQNQIDSLHLKDNIGVSYTGTFDLFQDSTRQLLQAFILAVILVFLVMAAQFESFKTPFVIMFSVPLIFIGVSLALYISHTPISATALIGLVVLAGIVVNNAIVLLDYLLQLKDRGWRTYDAIIETVKLRTRPILMTALTTILGLIPVAFGIGQGTEIQQPMGITVIGGMISSTFLTLIVVPVIYSFFDKETRRKKNFKNT
jgi:hydrophobic/amphiphilic exporter-1 (mainly G- bacteria), HAE1 family